MQDGDNSYDACGFIDETVPDGSMVGAGCVFDKTWTIQNIGNTIWQNRYLLCMDMPCLMVCPDGYKIDNYQLKPDCNLIALPTTAPQQTITITMRFTAPSVAGRYISYWKMVDEQGRFCFANAIGLSAQILVMTTGIACVANSPPPPRTLGVMMV